MSLVDPRSLNRNCWKWSTASLYIRAYVFSYTRPNLDDDTQTAVKPMTKGREI